MRQILEKYKWIIIGVNIIVILLIVLLIYNPSKIKNYNNKYFSGKYDSTWKLTKNSETLEFKNKGNKIVIQSVEIDRDNQYLGIDDLYENINETILKQNNSYKFLKSSKESLTRHDYEGYKILYESGKNQVMVSTFKGADRVVLISYIATSDYFDILLDSAENIIYNLNIKEKTPKLDNNIKLNTQKIVFGDNKKLSKKLNKTVKEKIFSNNYQVVYTLPSIFEKSNYNSSNGNFNYSLDDLKMKITTSVMGTNIYRLLEKYDSKNDSYIYKGFKGKKDFKNFKSYLSEYGRGYLYKHSYKSKNIIDKSKNIYHETYVIIYSLNKLYTFEVEIDVTGGYVPKELIDMIKVKKTHNYANHLTCKLEGDLDCELKQIINGKDVVISFNIPDKYKEVDKSGIISQNSYEVKNIVGDYDNKLDLNNYEIEMKLVKLNLDSLFNLEKKNFESYSSKENYREISFEKNITLNDKEFKVYSGGYTDTSGTMLSSKNRHKYYVNNKLIIYEIKNFGCVCIHIKGNNADITDEIIKDFTNFEVKLKD